MPDHTPYQKKVIGRYYERRDEILLARLGEIVTELSLAETDRKRDRLWGRARQAMQAMKVGDAAVDYIIHQRDPQLLARRLREWLSGRPRSANGPP